MQKYFICNIDANVGIIIENEIQKKECRLTNHTDVVQE
jgi:hypothetical protein